MATSLQMPLSSFSKVWRFYKYFKFEFTYSYLFLDKPLKAWH